MRTLYIEAGHGGRDPGAVGQYNGRQVTEAELTQDLQARIVKKLAGTANKLGWQIKTDVPNLTLAQVLRWLRLGLKQTDALVSLHFNAGRLSSTGVECIVPEKTRFVPSYGPTGTPQAHLINNAVNRVLDIEERPTLKPSQTPRKRVGILELTPNSILIEVCFISNPAELAKYIENRDAVAEELAEAIAQAYLK